MFSLQTHAALLVLGCVALASSNHDLNENETYLEPYLNDLVDYRESAVGKQYIMLADLVDALPTFLVDLFIPLLIPGSTLTIPVNIEIPFEIPGKVPLPLNITVKNVTLKDLNEFKKLLPLKLVDHGKFTWHSLIEMDELDIDVAATLELLGQNLDVNIAMPLKNASIDLKTIVAFDRTKLCSVWGHVMTSSLECAVWPLSNYESDGVSGVNMTDLTISIDDFDFQMELVGMNSTALQSMLDQLKDSLLEVKPTILSNLPGNISQSIRSLANDAFLHSIPKFQREHPCEADPQLAPADIVNVSRMCISNNAAFVLKWLSHDCPAHFVSSSTSGYDVDQTRCMDMTEAFPGAVEGDILRVQTHAVAGLHHIIEPALRYVPNSNAAGFECSGATLTYHCDVVSVAPIDPSVMPSVSQICIMNHAGFVMWYEVQNQRTGSWADHTSHYPINQKKCINLGNVDGVMDGDQFKTRVHAIAGKENYVDRDLMYSDNGLIATYDCTGTTLNYHCRLLVGAEGDEAMSIFLA
jgi:hypothetical protein